MEYRKKNNKKCDKQSVICDPIMERIKSGQGLPPLYTQEEDLAKRIKEVIKYEEELLPYGLRWER